MRLLRSPVFVCVLLSHLVFTALWGLRLAGGLQPLELIAYDILLSRLAKEAPIDPRISIVWLTEEAQATWGWPLPDERLAELLERLLAHQPRAIGLDVYRDREEPRGNRVGQLKLAEVLTRHREVIAIMKFGDHRNKGVPPPPALAATEQFGFNDFVDDLGGTIRRGLLFLDDGEHFFPYFGLQLALRYLEPLGIFPQPDAVNPDLLRLGKTTIPPLDANYGGYVGADARGYQFLFDYPGAPARFPSVTVAEVLQGHCDPALLQEKIVIIGSNAASTPDQFHTPLSQWADTEEPRYFGATMHGYATSQLLRMALDGTPPLRAWTNAQETLWLWVWTMLGGLAGLLLRAIWRLLLVAALGLMLLSGLAHQAFLLHWWLPWVPPALGWLVAAAAVVSYLASLERRSRAIMMQLFARRVSPKVAELYWQERDRILDEGRILPQKLHATVLFSDLQDFTTYSEQMDPEVLMGWLNEYMDTMVERVFDYGGQVDKLIGDAIMAVFGVPLARETPQAIAQDAIHAVQCALAMEQALRRLHQHWGTQGRPPVKMRIGIFSGPLVAGSLGSVQRQEYTVIGDTVNTASRLESFDKTLDADRLCRILIGETTRKLLNDSFLTEPVGQVMLKGKAGKITAYRVTGQRPPERLSEKFSASIETPD